MVEGASLESLYVGNCIEGSNPFLSAENALLPEAHFSFHRAWKIHFPKRDERKNAAAPAAHFQNNSLAGINEVNPIISLARSKKMRRPAAHFQLFFNQLLSINPSSGLDDRYINTVTQAIHRKNLVFRFHDHSTLQVVDFNAYQDFIPCIGRHRS